LDICAMWIPDESGWERLSAVRATLSGIAGTSPGFYPHISLGVYYGVDFDLIDERTRLFAREARPFSVFFTGFRLVNPSVLVLEAANEGCIKHYHAAFHTQLDEYADEWTRLSPYKYLPHSTMLNMSGRDFSVLEQVVQRDFLPFCIRIDKLQLSRSFEEERYEILTTYDLKD